MKKTKLTTGFVRTESFNSHENYQVCLNQFYS